VRHRTRRPTNAVGAPIVMRSNGDCREEAGAYAQLLRLIAKIWLRRSLRCLPTVPVTPVRGRLAAVSSLTFDDTPLAWSDVAARFAEEPNWWIGTVGRSGPHTVPTWGVVVSDVLYFYGEPDALRSRHLAADSRIVLHLPDPLDVLWVKGTAVPGPPIRERADLCDAYRAKYDAEDDRRWLPDAPGMENALAFAVAPRRAVAFQPADAAVWSRRVWVASGTSTSG
jgi:hypothetical protein